MKDRISRFVVALVASTVAVVSAQAPDVLDLTQPRVSSGPTSNSPITGLTVGRSPHATTQPSGVQLRLESLDKHAYRDGEPFVFRVSLINPTKESITLPWEPDPSQVATGPGAPLIKALLVIDVESSQGRRTVPIAMLYGSKMSPGNTKVLHPGGRAEVIARGSWEFVPSSSEDLRAAAFPRNVNVAARLIFPTNIDGDAFSDLSSGNLISIELERRGGK